MVKQSAQIEYNRTKLAETTLTSPFDGVVIRRSRECGAVVNPGVSIMEVAATDEIWGTVWVDETAVSKLKVGQKAQIVFRSQPDQPYAATVRRLPGRAGVRRGGRLMAEANDDRPPMMAWLHAKGRELVIGRNTGMLILCWTCPCCRPRVIAEFVTNGGTRTAGCGTSRPTGATASASPARGGVSAMWARRTTTTEARDAPG